MTLAGCKITLSVLALIATTSVALGNIELVPERRSIVVENMDFYGGDLEPRFNTTLETCENICLSNTKCTAFTYNFKSSACFPKAGFDEMRTFDGAISARIVELPDKTREQIGARSADLTFLPDGYLEEANTLAGQIGLEFPPGNREVEALLAEAQKNKPRRAARLYAAALNVEDAADVWVKLSRSFMLINEDDYYKGQSFRRRSVAAAVNGYLRSERASQQASALDQLARALIIRGNGRQAIDALRLSQSLVHREDTQPALDDAISKYGFRIVGHSVDSNTADPRICVTLSEDLKDGTDYGPFVRLDQRDLPVEAEGQQVCIDGVEHGARYKFTVRKGLPSASGEKLNRSVDLDVYVKDRNPAVRFTGRSYVLPKSAKATIPVVSVNINEIDLRIHRIGVRNLRTVAQRNMLGEAIDGYREREIGRDLGAPVWEGIGDVERRLNEDVTTALPIGDAITKFEPGVYVVTARAGRNEPWIDAATQWFVVTDLGLATLSGADGLHVFARSLASAEAVDGAEVQLIAFNNEVLATGTTNSEGYLNFAPGLTRGEAGMAPAMITIQSNDGDFAFLDLTDSGFDLADRGVEGRTAPGPIDVFVSTERGAYRPGETVNVTILARDARAMSVADLPLTTIISRPDGVEQSRVILKDEGAGGRSLSFDLDPAAARGAWEIAIHADPDSGPLARESFLVEDFTPERVDFDLSIAAKTIRLSDVPDLKIVGRYLYGAPAADMPISGRVRIGLANGLEDFPGYSFGIESERVSARVESLPGDLTTDANGSAVIPLSLPRIDGVTRPLEMEAIIQLRDGSGRPVERVLKRALAPVSPMIGVKPLFEDAVQQGGLARFEVIGVDRNAARTDLDSVGWEVSKIETEYQWYEVGGSWRYEPTTRRERVASGELVIGTHKPAIVEASVEWGRYELKLITTDGPYTASSFRFDAGWYAPVIGSDTPDTLEVSLDKERYKIGETAKLRVNARFAGKVLVAALDNRIIDMKAVDIDAGESLIDMPVTEDWGPGAYLTATLIRPMNVDTGRNPSRAIGVQWAEVDVGDRKFDVSFLTPDKVNPRGPMQAKLRIVNLPEGETAYATIAAVDVGVLNITGFDAPEPGSHYFGQRHLGVDIRDVYGRLIDGSLGTPGRIRSGGDGPASIGASPPPNEDVLAFFSGVLEVGEDGTASASFDMPDFNGTVKLMAIVWSDTGVGNAEKDVKVVDPVVVSVSAPRFLAPGDQSRILLEVAHSSGPKGDVTLEVDADEGLILGKSSQRLDLQSKASLLIPVTAKTVGDHKLRFVTTTPDGKRLTKSIRLSVRANDPEVLRQNRISLAADGGTLTVDANTFEGLREGTGRATLTVGPLARFDVPGLLRELDQYPYGCTEQTTSRAFPLLHFNDVASAMGIDEDKGIEERIGQAVRKVLANQTNGGSFGLWRPANSDAWLDAYVTDFLSQARLQGHDVPEQAMKAALSNLRNRVAYAGDSEDKADYIAYALMVMAREGAASIGDLRYYADAKVEALSSPLAKAQLGMALATYGEQKRADTMFRLAAEQALAQKPITKHFWRDDYGSTLRDAAGVLALSVEAGSDAVDREALVGVVNPRGISGRRTSTQEKVWTLFAAKALINDASSGDIKVDGAAIDGPMVRVFEDQAVGDRTVVIMNEGNRSSDAVLTTFGIPSEAPVSGGNGFEISRAYYTLEGEKISPKAVAQNDRLVAVIRVKGKGAPAGRLMVNDPLPAGFEIDNPKLLRAGDIDALEWLSVRATETLEFRTDRLLAAVDSQDNESFEIAYIVRAVSPGRFYHPAASVEDMYRPDYRANSDAGWVEVLGALK